MTALTPRPSPAKSAAAAVRGRRRALAAALAVLAGIGLTACGSRPSQRAGATSNKPIVVGISLPLTGDFSQPGTEARRGYEVWAGRVNAAGGLLGRQVQLKIVDDASNQDTVVTDYTKLITQDRVDLVLGTFSSLLNYPASAVAEKNGKVYVEPAGGATKMFTRGFKNLFFAQQATAPHQADVFVNWVKSLPAEQRPRTAAYPTQDDPFAAPVIKSMQTQLQALGVQTVYSSTYPADTTNFQSIASQMAGKRPDLIAQGAVFEDGVGLIRSLKQLRYSPKMMFQTSAPSNAGQYSDGIGLANTEGIFYTVSWHQDAVTPLNKEFVSGYKAAYNNADPAEDAADAFAAAQVLQAAATAVGSLDQAKIRDWLHANTVQTILGPLSWQPTGEPKGEFLLGQWQSGKAQIVAPEAVATSKTVVNPKPDWK
jgi:branched-chain amino acid transport system substrate-binding protein